MANRTVVVCNAPMNRRGLACATEIAFLNLACVSLWAANSITTTFQREVVQIHNNSIQGLKEIALVRNCLWVTTLGRAKWTRKEDKGKDLGKIPSTAGPCLFDRS